MRAILMSLILGFSSSVTAAVSSSRCPSSDPNNICLGVKVVVYEDSEGRAVSSGDDIINSFKAINSIWSQCDISFHVDAVETVNPVKFGLNYQTQTKKELDKIRLAFGVDSSLLVVATGKWDRSGSLGKSSANAWTSLPKEGPFGAILEKPVVTYANLLAHELGHYLDLEHSEDRANLMNPVIYAKSTRSSPQQCQTARFAAKSYWHKMMR